MHLNGLFKSFSWLFLCKQGNEEFSLPEMNEKKLALKTGHRKPKDSSKPQQSRYKI